MNNSILCFAVIVMTCCCGCATDVDAGAIYCQSGEYAYLQSGLIVEVKSMGNRLLQLVVYESRDDLGKVVFLGPHDRFSSFSKWFICFDAQSRLWMYSGDIGTYVIFIKGNVGNGKIESRIATKEDIPEMPNDFWQAISEKVDWREFTKE